MTQCFFLVSGVNVIREEMFGRQSTMKLYLMNRMANADEYQGTLLWMLSDASSYLNGAIVPGRWWKYGLVIVLVDLLE